MMNRYPEFDTKAKKIIDTLSHSFATIRAGRANASILDRVAVDYYGTPTPVGQIASVSTPEPRILVMTPYLPDLIEGAAAVTGLTVSHAVTGEKISLPVSAVFVCAGTVANTELVKDWLPLGSEGRIKAGEDTETGVPGVYAAGDIREKPLYQIVTAAADGAVAAVRAGNFIQRA